LKPEGDETFILNITSVTLMGNQPPAGAEPSVRLPGNILIVTINENDNARGIIQFNVTTVCTLLVNNLIRYMNN